MIQRIIGIARRRRQPLVMVTRFSHLVRHAADADADEYICTSTTLPARSGAIVSDPANRKLSPRKNERDKMSDRETLHGGP
jgi:hypothetical protein